MQDAEDFDEFYKSARTALLQQTFALTGDLPASRGAVRDAFVAAWHHWRKVSRLEDREAWVRPLAWRHAQRRHSARIFHRDRKLDPGIRATLDALAKLPLVQRKVLLLTQLTSAPMAEIAREVGLPSYDAEERLQTATTQFSLYREVPTTGIRPLFEPLLEHVSDARWPRVTIVRRAGTARRRTHTLLGAGAVVGALALGGVFVTDAEGIQPSLAGARAGSAAHWLTSGPSSPTTGPAGSPSPSAPAVTVSEDDLVTADQVGARLPGHWRALAAATAESGKTGITMPCQTTRYADPEGTSAVTARFRAPARKDQPRQSVTQTVEVSGSSDGARSTYATMVGWFAGCTDARMQLVATYDVGQVGDDAKLLVLRSWQRPASTLMAAVARTGSASTVTVSKVSGTGRPQVTAAAGLLGDAVNALCRLPGTGACAEQPALRVGKPVPTGDQPAMLSEVDLPPVSGIDKPWIGTETRTAHDNLAASRCDSTSFDTKAMRKDLTRSFVIPEAKLSDLFGLTETIGQLPPKQARAFVAAVRTKLASCHDKQLGTDVVRVADVTTKGRSLTVWHVRTEISQSSSVTYLMGIVRDGGSVAQIGFVPDGKVEMAPGAFIALVHRALDRLPQLGASS
jgi:DNA-directed RNA polymerase specialized sigma24 family protein